MSRLHIRYAAGEVDQDLMLQPTTGGMLHQQRYIVASDLLELDQAFPACGEATPSVPTDLELTECAPPAATVQSSGCSTAPSGWTGVFAGLVLLTLRRRRQA